ncbi:organic anion transporter, putative [Plasmodium gallinaceum]|uniref:Organic anion transporter, putative n=1 Tax=Plasmodium gallinaceum TaxID=5849 RepID=A0A1J1GMY8_PLAGA|nr:organic anion transporter, putative [Plasmodium gallinaceum]CRG93724.1 organic anion transporter, putative [Plasmodium gallinaceum]
MNTIEKTEADKTQLNQKNDDYKSEDTSCLKINVCEENNKEYLSSIDDVKLWRFSCVRGLENYVIELKKKVNKFYLIYTVITLIHFLIYVNRGIIPGSYDYISAYLKGTHEISNVDVHIGFLTSVFVFGLSISSIISGSLGSAYSIFKVTDIFLLQNSLALFLTGFSFIIGSYYTLMFSRFFCGFSESAFLTIIPPLIYSYSKNRAGSWISVFITMFPLGGCFGYLLAVILPSINISIAQYFIISSFVFFIFFVCFYFFDEKLLKQYEEEKILKEKKQENKENDLEEGNQLKEENNLKEDESSKNVRELENDKRTTLNKTNNNDIETAHKPSELNVENKKNNEKKKKEIEENNNNNNTSNNIINNCADRNSNNINYNYSDDNNKNIDINSESKKEHNINTDSKEKINYFQRNNERKKYRSTNEKKKRAKSISNNNNTLYSNNLNLIKLKSRNFYKNKNFKNEHRILKFSESKKLSTSSLKNFTNLKHISCVKRVNSNDNSKNKNSTDYSDHKSFDDSYRLHEKNPMSLYNDDELYNVEKSINESNNVSFNSTKKIDVSNSFISKNKIVKDDCDEREILNNNYVDNKSDNMYNMNTYSNDNVCLISTQESFNKKKKENFIDINLNDNLEKLDEEVNEELNLSILVKATLLNPCFLYLVTSLTAHIVIIQSYLVYGPAILYALDVFPTYKFATIICSLSACVSSIIGTCLGGFLMDLYDLNIQNIDKNYEDIKNNKKRIKLYNNDILVYKYLRIIGLQTFIILFIACIFVFMFPFIQNLYIFTVAMVFGLTFLFSSMPGHNIGVMVCVPQNIRPFSMGMSSFISHIFGDIPWIVIIGSIKGTLSPNCIVTRDGEISDLCREERWGLKITLLIVCVKSLIMALGSLFLYLHSNKKIKKLKNRKNKK